MNFLTKSPYNKTWCYIHTLAMIGCWILAYGFLTLLCWLGSIETDKAHWFLKMNIFAGMFISVVSLFGLFILIIGGIISYFEDSK